jgi:hypothetical protein
MQYSVLGMFKPYKKPLGFTPYARRVEHRGRHAVRPVPGQFLRWTHSVLRDAGEFLNGALQPIREAL